MRHAVFLISVILMVFSGRSPSVAQSDIFAGQWRTDWGPAEVFRDGAGFRGTYKAEDGNTDDDGTFVLSKNGKTWTGFWAEPSSNEKCDTKRFGTYYWGRLKLASAFSERGFDMNWGYCDFGEPDRLWVFNIKTGSAQTAVSRPVYKASSVIKNLESGFWRGVVRSDAQGYASYCSLSAQKQDETFVIQLYWNSDGFHVLIYSPRWSLNTGDEFQGRVRIDKRFDGLIDASIFDSESIDYTFGFNTKAREAFQRGSRIWLEGPLGKKTFKLNGTRKAIDVLQDCAQEYLQADNAPVTASAPSFEKGLAAYKAKDFAGALANWRPLAQQGDARLQTYVGEMYRDGEGVAQDYVEAVRWFKLAARQGNVRAQNALGLRYYRGQGVTTNFEKAAYWFEAAAKQGNATAQNNIGEMYRDGEGVARNTDKAKAWFRKAAKQGHARAQSNLEALLTSSGSSVVILSDDAEDIGKPFTLEILGDSRTEAGRTVLYPDDKIDVMFTALADLSARSWIGFVADDAAQSPEPEHFRQETIKNRTDGIMELGVPSTLGDYRLWMYDRANGIMLAEERVRIAVDMDSAALAVPAGVQLEPGQSFTVKFEASPSYTFYTWVAVLDADTPRDKKVPNFPYGRFYLENRADGILTFTAPTAPGRYILRMHESYFKKTLTEVVLTVVDPNASVAPAPSVETGAITGGVSDRDQDDVSALIDQAFDLLEGDDPAPQAAAKARQLVETAVANGDRRALLLLSLMLESGIGGPADPDKARDYLDQAADALLPDALYRRALLTVETDPDSALRDIRLAAAEGFVPALQVYATLSYWESFDPDAGENPPPPPSVAKGELIAIQAMLASLGYQAGPPLGEMTENTTAAIMAFQKDENLPVDGFPTLELRDQLVKAIAGGN